MDWPNDATTLDALAKRLADDLSPAGMTYLAELLNRYAKKRLNAYRRSIPTTERPQNPAKTPAAMTKNLP